MADGGIGGEEFSVKSGALGLGGQLLGEKDKGGPGTTEALL